MSEETSEKALKTDTEEFDPLTKEEENVQEKSETNLRNHLHEESSPKFALGKICPKTPLICVNYV